MSLPYRHEDWSDRIVVEVAWHGMARQGKEGKLLSISISYTNLEIAKECFLW